MAATPLFYGHQHGCHDVKRKSIPAVQCPCNLQSFPANEKDKVFFFLTYTPLSSDLSSLSSSESTSQESFTFKTKLEKIETTHCNNME